MTNTNTSELDVWGALTDAADDYELAQLEDIGIRAGVIWRCQADRGDGRPCGWIGRADETECGDGRHPRMSTPVDSPCEACGAEAGEECRTDCIGEQAEMDKRPYCACCVDNECECQGRNIRHD